MFLTLYYIIIIMVYARFKRTRKGSGAYGRKRTFIRRRRTACYKKVSRPRFALSGFRKNIEKKYLDKTYQSDMNETLSGNIDQTTKTNNGVTVISNTWGQYTFGQQTAPIAVSNDVLKGLDGYNRKNAYRQQSEGEVRERGIHFQCSNGWHHSD